MKTIILAAAVAAFELAFFVSIATPPTETVSAVQPGGAERQALAQGSEAPVPCTPRG